MRDVRTASSSQRTVAIRLDRRQQRGHATRGDTVRPGHVVGAKENYDLRAFWFVHAARLVLGERHAVRSWAYKPFDA